MLEIDKILAKKTYHINKKNNLKRSPVLLPDSVEFLVVHEEESCGGLVLTDLHSATPAILARVHHHLKSNLEYEKYNLHGIFMYEYIFEIDIRFLSDNFFGGQSDILFPAELKPWVE